MDRSEGENLLTGTMTLGALNETAIRNNEAFLS